MFCSVCRRHDRAGSFKLIKLDSSDVQEFDLQPTIDVWMQKKRTPDLNDRGSRIEVGRQAEGDPDLVETETAHDTAALLWLWTNKQLFLVHQLRVPIFSTMLRLKMIVYLTTIQMIRMRLVTF